MTALNQAQPIVLKISELEPEGYRHKTTDIPVKLKEP